MILRSLPVLAMVGVCLGSLAALAAVRPPSPQSAVSLTTLAYRVHDMDRMVAFYSEAFGVRFRTVQTGPFASRFAELGGMTLKFVPIREAADFTGFPVHQPGFTVPDVGAVIAVAERHGGRVQDAPARRNGRLQAAIRDPDGNTVELYGR
jgi:catechol 2,3-dioxygenase-like lactoylglutathione lyase family enzyme